MRCRVCGSARTKEFLDLGEQPLANRLLSGEDLDKPEPRYPLGLEYCKDCMFVQLTHVVPPEEMFSDYPYATGTSSETRAHFEAMAEDVLRECNLAPKGALVVDVGSNDGTLLRAFQQQGAAVHGIEPAENLVKLANGSGIPTLHGYFDRTAALIVERRCGKADVITACNVFTHTDDVHGFLRTAKQLLKPEGTLVLEVYYLWDFLRNGAFDQVYHEHLSYFSLRTLAVLLGQEGFQIWHVDKVPVQGGSLRVYASRSTRSQVDEDNTVFEVGILEPGPEDTPSFYVEFAAKAKESRRQIRTFLNTARHDKKSVIGYAASAKASTLLNYCGLGRESLECIVDMNPLKQGKYMPGVHVPIHGPGVFNDGVADLVLIFSWNIANEVVQEWGHLKEKGVRFFVPLPELVEVG